MAIADLGAQAQMSVIGSMLIDERCVPLVLSELAPEDFVDGVCRSTFTAIRRLVREGRPVDPVTVVDAMQGGERYIQWSREVMELTPTAANVGEYIPMVREHAARRRVLELMEALPEAADHAQLEALVRRMMAAVSITDRVPMMTGPERAADFHRRMSAADRPKYLPWGVPTADRCVYAELGDMVLLGGYASSGKTLLSIAMATAQAKAGYKVGYYSLETSPQKITDRQLAALAGVPLWKIKARDFTEEEWARFARAESFAASEGSFAVIDAAGLSAEDVAAHAVAHSFQVVYVDYVQNLLSPGIRGADNYARVTAISQSLKTFSRSTGTAVVALAQLSRPSREDGRPVPPSMHSFKESGQLEQDADVAFLLYPSDPNDNSSNRIFKIGKNKEGPREQAELVFHGDTQTMAELEPGTDNSIAAKLNAQGRAIKRKNRARAQKAQFQELEGGDGDNPFEN